MYHGSTSCGHTIFKESNLIMVVSVSPPPPIVLVLVHNAPTGVTGAALDFNALRVTWTPPSVPNGIITDHLVGYSIQYVWICI